ncbi:MAG TPA: DUF2939 domain-containing protein [Caulobacter sp.]|nr:DUF2939 domain-containing protein [Caulobacter sp.]
MTRTNRILIGAGVGVLLALLVAGYFASPILALHGLTAAAKAGDRSRLEQAVDFPAVRESLKTQLNAAMTRKFEEDPKLRDNPFAAFGQLLLGSVVDKAIDAYATPDAIASMVATNEPPKTISTAPDRPVVEPTKPKAKSETEVRYGYQDLNHFRATYRDRKHGDDEPFALILERRGVFSWKLVRIELPGLAL